MSKESIILAFVTNCAQCLVLCIVLIINRDRAPLYKLAIYIGAATNGAGALMYLKPIYQEIAVGLNNVGDFIFLLGVLVSYAIKSHPTWGQRVMITGMFIFFLMWVTGGLGYFFDFPPSFWKRFRSESQTVQKVDSLSGDVSELKVALADSSSARAVQVMGNRTLLIQIVGLLQQSLKWQQQHDRQEADRARRRSPATGRPRYNATKINGPTQLKTSYVETGADTAFYAKKN